MDWKYISVSKSQLLQKLKTSELKKLKSLAETKWDNIEYHDVEKIRNKINQKKDLFNRGHVYKLVDIDNSYPDFIIKNKEKLKDWIV